MGVNVVMLGPPGAGKGTQGERYARAHGVPRIATGDILREAIKTGTPFGVLAGSEMARGELVADETMIAIVRERLGREDARNGFVLDGFPRTVPQARALDAMFEGSGRGPLVVVDVKVPHDELVRRLAGRRICRRCGADAGPAALTCERCGGELVQRPDDTREVVAERLRVYERATRPLVDYYRDWPTFRQVDGARAADEVARDVETAIAAAAEAGVRVAKGGSGS